MSNSINSNKLPDEQTLLPDADGSGVPPQEWHHPQISVKPAAKAAAPKAKKAAVKKQATGICQSLDEY